MMEDDLEKDYIKTEYHRGILVKLLLIVVCIVGIVLFVGLFSLSAYNGVSLADTYEIIWNHIVGNEYPSRSLMWWADRYIWNTAMPHAVAAIAAGAGLAVCGAMMQAMLSNPLADPYSTGISSGACFGAVSAIVMGVSFSTVAGEMGIVTNAFLGAMIPAVLIILIAQRIRMTPATLILLGTAISYFFNSMVTYLMVTSDADTLQEAYMWQIGSLDGIDWNSLYLMVALTIVGSAFVLALSSRLNVMSQGENVAISMGVDIQKFRVVCLILTAIVTAAIVSFTGILGFVGLVAPHIVRLVIGSDNRFVVPMSMGVGALLLLIADYLAFQWSNIPVGVILSIIGSPIFFALIVWQNKKTGAIYRCPSAISTNAPRTSARAEERSCS